MLWAWIPAPEIQAAEAVDATVYVDAANGSDNNDGTTEATAKKTLDGAYAALAETMTALGKANDATARAKIILVTDYQWEFSTDTSKKYRDIASSNYTHTYEVVYTGKNPDVGLYFTTYTQSYVGVIGPTTFENMHIALTEESALYLSLHGRGWLRIGEGVTNSTNPNLQLSISPLPYYKSSETYTGYLEINSGVWRNAYAGTYNTTATGNSSLVIGGGTVNKACVVFNGTLNGNADITVNGGTVNGIVAGAANSSGKVNGDVQLTLNGGTLCGTLTHKNVSGTSTVTLAPAKGVSLETDGVLTVNHLTGGDLSLAAGAQLAVTDSVTGTTRVTAQGGLRYGSYITAPAATADSAIVFTEDGITVTADATTKTWQCTDAEKIVGLKLQAASGVTVKLYPGFSGGTAITPLKTETQNGITSYYFPNLKGSYRYTASGTGYYSITKNLYVSPEEAQVLSTLDVTPSKRDGKGWEPTKVVLFTDEYMENFPDDASLWPDYPEAFLTPEFTTQSAEHRHTTQKEMEDFIQALDAQTDYMYTYTIGISPFGNALPMAVYTKTDLSQAKSLEEVAELLNGNGKLTIHYQGQMHGNEPAGGEGVLAMMLKLCGEYGEDILDTVNIYCLPRVNPDGAQNDVRNSPTTGIDQNRDFLLARNVEVQYVHRITNLFNPLVMIDSHEYTAEPERTSEAWQDLLISPGFNPTSGEDFVDLGITMTQDAFAKAEEQGLSYNYYTGLVNSKAAYVGRNYAALEGTLFFLIETRGIYFGNEIYGRRTVGHLITATSFIDYIVENVDTVRSVVTAEKQRIIDTGKTYEESDVLVLESSESKHPELNLPTVSYNTATGVGTPSTISIKVVDVIDRSRPAPTAYVIPAEESWTQQVLDLMDIHTIDYTFVPAGSAISLQGYTGTTTEATLTEETAVSFPNGAYVMTMAQEEAKVLAMLMEPDVTDIAPGNSTLAMAGIIPTTNSFPIYRYIQDLNTDGSISYTVAVEAPTGLTAVDAADPTSFGAITGLDATKVYEYRSADSSVYTALPLGTTQITDLPIGTYYVRFPATATSLASADVQLTVGFEKISEYVVYLSTTGSDSNEGYSADTPVATVAQAYSQLDQIMADAPQGTAGKIVLSGLIDLGTAVFNFPACDYPVVITGKTASDGFTYAGGGTDKTTIINFHGDTTLEYMTLKLTSSQNYNYIGGNGHKLVLGEGLNCIANSKGAYFNLCGGSYAGTHASTDLTIRSGSWRNIYYGSYTGTVTGDARLTMTGGTFTNYIQAGYSASVNGDCYVNLSGVEAGTRIVAGPNNSGTVKGNATVVLGKGITGTPVIAPANKGAISGTYTLVLDGADISAMTVSGKNITSGTVGSSVLLLQDGTLGAVSDFGSVILQTTGYVRLGTDVTVSPQVKGNSSLDLKGYTLTGDLTGDGTLYLMDSSSDEYALPTGGLEGSVSCQLPGNFKTSITGAIRRYMVLKTDTGYTSHRFYLSITKVSVRTGNTGFGYKAKFYGDEAVLAQIDSFGFRLNLEGNETVVTKTVTAADLESGREYSLLLQNFDIEAHGDIPVHANVFLKLTDNTEIHSSSVSYSMKTMLQKVCQSLSDFSEEKLAALRTMCAPYKATMENWNIEDLLQ